ncbi:MAG: hypothetical protein QXH80_03845 [Candidatus Nanoarchaeia archaeon]
MKRKIPEHISELILKLQNAGFETYLVGGAVRDILLDRRPKDFDISTSATPEQIRTIFGRRHSMIIGKRFRLVHYFHNGSIIEISTFRKKPSATEQTNSLHSRSGNLLHRKNIVMPDNEFGSASEDAWRRDFTVNAIFYDPTHEKVVDFTEQGINDLKQGTIRTIGNPEERITEDPVRIIRGIKLEGQYGFKMENSTSEAITKLMPLIKHCSLSRLSLELQKILQKTYSDAILKSFYAHGFLKYYLPWLHKHWETNETEYMLKLLAERNKRVEEGTYRDSISLVLSIIALPFIESKFGKLGDLWENFFGVDKEIRQIVISSILPCFFPKLVIAAAVRTLLAQPQLRSMTSREKFKNNFKYAHARELLALQNNVAWKSKEIDEYLQSFLAKT